MTSGVVAAVTIRQAPREDLLGEMRALLPRANWIQHGALDEFGDRDLSRLAPGDVDFPVVTRLKAGRRVIVGERAIRPLMQQAVDRVAAEADLVIVLCSTPMPLETRAPVLFPDRLLSAAVSSLAAGSKIEMRRGADWVIQALSEELVASAVATGPVEAFKLKSRPGYDTGLAQDRRSQTDRVE